MGIRSKERERAKKARQRARVKAAKLAVIAVARSKTDPAYRRQLPPLPEMSKSAMRAMLTQAVRNTAGMQG